MILRSLLLAAPSLAGITRPAWLTAQAGVPRYNSKVTLHEYIVFNVAADELEMSALLSGIGIMSASGERFPLFTPLTPEEARNAVLALLEQGYVQLQVRDSQMRATVLEEAEALSKLRDPSALAADSVLWRHELLMTPDGEAAWSRTPPELVSELEKAHAAAKRSSKEFVAKHPGHYERMAQWLTDLGRWVEKGGTRPRHPYKGSDW